MYLFQANQLHYSRNDVALLENITFDLRAGDVLQLVGFNGSGKTTLLKILTGLLQPQQGDVLWNGVSIFQDSQNYVQNLFYLSHHRGIKKEFTVLENLNFDWKFQTKNKNEIFQIISRVNIAHLVDKPIKYLSQGQQQRVILAKLLLSKTRLWLLDEPFSSLDAQGSQMVERMLEQHTEVGGVAIVTTHQPIQWLKIPVKFYQL